MEYICAPCKTAQNEPNITYKNPQFQNDENEMGGGKSKYDKVLFGIARQSLRTTQRPMTMRRMKRYAINSNEINDKRKE